MQLIYGEQDQFTPPSIGEDMKDQLANARLSILAGAGHLSNLEKPEEFNETLVQFLNQHASLDTFSRDV